MHLMIQASGLLSRVPLIIKPDNDNEKYLRTKQELMGHMLNMK